MKKQTLIAGLCLLLCSCTTRSCQKWQREKQISDRNYSITLYSGGKAVFTDHLSGVINQEDGDGVYYFKGDTLIEIAGPYVIKSVK